MRLGKLLRYSIYLLVTTVVLFFIVTIYLYYFSNKSSFEIAYSFVVPICMFAVSFLYSRKVHEKGLLRGAEIWIIYLALVMIMKLLLNCFEQINMVQNLIYLPISILGGILGVNSKLRVSKG
ncbi:MAG: TIGR04086 family membrane protein [Sedimentibacter sp.]